jgi:hypothetical protein
MPVGIFACTRYSKLATGNLVMMDEVAVVLAHLKLGRDDVCVVSHRESHPQVAARPFAAATAFHRTPGLDAGSS